jgi:hypothetical protein
MQLAVESSNLEKRSALERIQRYEEVLAERNAELHMTQTKLEEALSKSKQLLNKKFKLKEEKASIRY